MELLNYLFCDMFVSVLECYELTHISWFTTTTTTPTPPHPTPHPHPTPPPTPAPPDPTMGCLIMISHSGFTGHSPAPQGVMHEWAGIVIHWLCNQKHPYVAVVQLLILLGLHFIMEWLLQSYFS